MISDPIEFELFKNALFGVADEMALTVFRTTYSGVLKDNMDYSTALFDGDGVLVAQGLTLPGHLGSMPTAIAAVKSAFAGRVDPGRRVHPQRPVPRRHAPARRLRVQADLPRRRRMIAWAGAVCHHTDVGGRVPGLERVGLDRDLPGGAAHPAAEALRARRAQRDAVRADREAMCGCRSRCSAICAPSSPPAISPSRRCTSWRRITARKNSRNT